MFINILCFIKVKGYFSYFYKKEKMEQYIELIKRIISEGKEKEDRTGTGTISIFGHQSVYDLSKGFPLLTAKATYTKGIIVELLWFLGIHLKDEKYQKFSMTNIKYLVDNNVNIWNEWAHRDMVKYQKEVSEKIKIENPNVEFNLKIDLISLQEFTQRIKEDDGFAEKWGNLGSVYGQQWRKWKFTDYEKTQENTFQAKIGFIDQIKYAIERLKTNPEDRGIIISAWNVGELDQMALRPCHTMFQLYAEPLSYKERLDVYEKNIKVDTADFKTEEKLDNRGVPKYKLSLQLYQRSADVFLGVPFNIASYSILLQMIAQVTNMTIGNFIHTFGDAHIYKNHKTQVNELLKKISPELRDNPESIDFYENKSLLTQVGNDWPVLPTLWLNTSVKSIEDFTIEDIKIKDYKPFPKIEAPIAV